MKYNYETKNNKYYLTMEFEELDSADVMTYGMLSNNQVKGVLPLRYEEILDRKFYKYDITGMVSLAQFMERKLGKVQVLSLLKSLVMLMMELPKYMLRYESFIWDLNYMFVNPKTYEVSMMSYGVLIDDNYHIDMLNVLKNLWNRLKFSDADGRQYIEVIRQYMDAVYTFDARGFAKCLHEAETVQSELHFKNVEEVRTNVLTAAMKPETPVVEVAEVETLKKRGFFSKKEKNTETIKKAKKEKKAKQKFDRKEELAQQMLKARSKPTANSVTYARQYSRNMNIPGKAQILNIEDVLA